MEKTYNPLLVEKKIYETWEKAKAFTPKPQKGQKNFTIIMPPPNANAPLHIGHARVIAIEDLLIRFHRLLGESTLWLPGADHAGIMTQVVYERKLQEQGQTRFDLGREKFYQEVYAFSQKNKEEMYNQTKALGASCDWSREKFTLDPQISTTVLETFVKMFKQNLVYRAERMINWCPRCQTALSDLEIEYKEETGKLWFIRYVFKNEDKFITVATTRPETLLGDTAVAVNPKDLRFKDLIGKTVVVPLVFREIPIISDSGVNMEFGTGAVKVTPAHDPIDFEIGQKNDLETIQVIGFDNRMTKKAGKYAGLTVKETRELLVADLESKGQIEKVEDYAHSVAHCERCKATLEPQVSLQWWVKTKPLAKDAIDVVEKGKIKIVPDYYEKIYFHWMENIRDWCISRQLWWGHQIPIWYCGTEHFSPLQKLMNPDLAQKDVMGCGEIIASAKKPKKCPKCGNTELIQDPDTLDTWFSSGQWPYTTLSYPDGNDYKTFYPTSVMETGYDILFFWVSRMIMLGLYRTHKVPFKTVYLHGLVRDGFGQKMSKSKGNVINPLTVCQVYGTDALRMALVFGSTPGTDIALSEDKIEAMRNFANKIWNASRFVLSFQPSTINHQPSSNEDDKHILKELQKITKSTTEDIEKFRLGQAAENLYEFFWHLFCDKYLEKVKNRLYADKPDSEALSTLLTVLETCLILLHPFMPFITEEIWQKLPDRKNLLINTQWPKK